MDKAERNSLIAVPVVVLVGAGMALAGSAGGSMVGSVPVFALCVALAFVIQWIAFVPSFVLQTERIFDLVGTSSFIAVAAVAVLLAPAPDVRSFLLLAMIVVWAARLGSYLVARVMAAGTDARFDAIKPSFARFLLVWTMQGLWVTVTLGPALAAITSLERVALDLFALAGLVIWACGFGIEVLADVQKRRFRADPANRGEFVRSGVWAWSRHPNYFGEVVLWIGVAVVAAPVLRDWQWLTMISPVFVYVLLTRVSGIPMLERKADERWGGRPDYEEYKSLTPVLVPRPPRASGARMRP